MIDRQNQQRLGSELEQALVDVVRVGARGNPSGVRQLARRLIRQPPHGVRNEEAFKSAIAGAVAAAAAAAASAPSVLRAIEPEEIPLDGETGLALADVDREPAPEPILDVGSSELIRRFVEERRRREELAEHGLVPSRTLLLLGPPGTGKTMSARYIAHALGLPLLTVDLASVMSSYLGKTGQNLRASLAYAKSHDCVVLLDEFDALAKRRDDESDIGELKRLVNVLLLELERWPWQSVLIAASNHPELLDRAIARRFDQIVRLELPGIAERSRLIARHLNGAGEPNAQWSDIAVWVTEGWSGSDIVRLLTDAARRAVLDDQSIGAVLRDTLEANLRDVANKSRSRRDELCRIASREWQMSDREIGRRLGISHPTVARALRRGTEE
jgi:MoxR-like ATPase